MCVQSASYYNFTTSITFFLGNTSNVEVRFKCLFPVELIELNFLTGDKHYVPRRICIFVYAIFSCLSCFLELQSLICGS